MTQAQPEAPAPEAAGPDLRVHLDDLLHARRMTAADLAQRVGIHPNNMSHLRQGKFSMLRRTTLVAICVELDCQPGDLLTIE